MTALCEIARTILSQVSDNFLDNVDILLPVEIITLSA